MNKVKRGLIIPLGIITIVALACYTAPEEGAKNSIVYPDSRRGDQVDDYHGEKVADPYRWLEDTDSEETAAWVKAQNEVTFGYLNALPERDVLEARLTELWNFERYGVPQKVAGQYFFTHNDGLQNQSLLYVTDDLDAEPRLLIDPNTFSEDGTTSLASWYASPNGQWLAYSLSHGGSDWREWKVRNIATGEDLEDHIQWSKFSAADWSHDSSGFYYARFDAPEEGQELQDAVRFQKIYYHQLGTEQEEDKLIYHRPDQNRWGFGSAVTDDGAYQLIRVSNGTAEENGVMIRDLSKNDSDFAELMMDFDAVYQFIDNQGDRLLFHTTESAPKGRVIEVDLKQPSKSQWREVVAETDNNLEGVDLIGGYLVADYLKNAQSEVVIYDLEGSEVKTVPLPGLGTVRGFNGDHDDAETFFQFTSFTQASSVYRYDVASGESTLFKAPEVAYNPEDFVTEQVFYPSKDGTEVPMFISYKKGMEKNGKNPTLLYAYGGFNVSITPSFSVRNLVWMEQGGVYASANIRGGGEFGEAWHEAGMLAEKQNVFDDFIAAGEFLIAEGWTSSDHLAMNGYSNGGLLVGAVMAQRPDLFAAAIPGVGVMDMLRFQKFTIGWAWVSDYGSSEIEEDFATLRAYSPLHNLQEGVAYPATMVTTADHDDRVVPGHSFKFAAALQRAHQGENPVLIRVETKAGHGAGKSTDMRIEAARDDLVFLLNNTR